MTLTSKYFDISKPKLDFRAVSKVEFKERRKVLINSLAPNQMYVEDDLIQKKRKGARLTTPYVLFYKGYSILMDGHHTTISKKLNGQKYIIALTLELSCK